MRVARTEQDIRALASLAIDPKSLEDDGFDYQGHEVIKPWGREYLIGSGGNMGIWKLHLNPESETSLHCHVNKSTALIVLEGMVTCSTITTAFPVEQWGVVYFEAGVFHSTATALGAVVMEIETPCNKRDLVRLSDKYGRGQGYEL